MRATLAFHPSMEARRIPAGPADNLTLAMDSYPEYPLISRTGTHGLPPLSKPTASDHGTATVGDLVAHRPGQMTDNRTRARPGPADPAPAVTAGVL